MLANPMTYALAALRRLMTHGATAAGVPGLDFSLLITVACAVLLLAASTAVANRQRSRSLREFPAAQSSTAFLRFCCCLFLLVTGRKSCLIMAAYRISCSLTSPAGTSPARSFSPAKSGSPDSFTPIALVLVR